MTYTVELPTDSGKPAAASGGYTVELPQQSATDNLIRGAGLAARSVGTAATGLANMVGDTANAGINAVLRYISPATDDSGKPYTPPQLGMPSEVTQRAMTNVGLPQAQTPTEKIVFNGIAPAVLGNAGFAKLAESAAKEFAPGTAQKILELLGQNQGTQAIGAAGAGAAGNAAQQGGYGPVGQLIASLLGGVAAPLAARTAGSAVAAGGRFVANAAAPFTEAGRNRIAGNTLMDFAQDPTAAQFNLSNIPETVPGSLPTTAEAARDVGLAQLQRTLANKSPEFAARQSANNAARVSALEDIAKTPEDLANAVAARSAEGNAGYGAASSTPLNPNTPIDPLLELLDRPAFRTAVKRAEQLAANNGLDLKNSLLDNTQGLHYVKMALDDMIGTASQQGIGAAERRSIIGTQNDFLKWLDQASPQYAQARQNFAQASGPINQMETLQDIAKRTQMAAPDIATGAPILSQAKWKAVVTNKLDELGKTLSPDQVDTLKSIGDDLDMGAGAAQAGKAIGSNTVQNLTTANLLGRTFGKAIGDNAIVRTLALPLKWLQQVPEGQVQDLIEQAMLDPTTARLLMSKATPNNVAGLGMMLQSQFKKLTQGALTGAAIQGTARQ